MGLCLLASTASADARQRNRQQQQQQQQSSFNSGSYGPPPPASSSSNSYGSSGNSASDANTHFIDDPKGSNIDFSRGTRNPDGTVCVERSKTVDKTEKNQLKECFVQNVTQCYYTYVTEYDDGEQEKCDEFYWKSCKIVFEERTFNATSR